MVLVEAQEAVFGGSSCVPGSRLGSFGGPANRFRCDPFHLRMLLLPFGVILRLVDGLGAVWGLVVWAWFWGGWDGFGVVWDDLEVVWRRFGAHFEVVLGRLGMGQFQGGFGVGLGWFWVVGG